MKHKEDVYLNACCMCTVEDGIWFVQGLCPSLYFYDFQEKKITMAHAIMIGETYGTAYFSDMCVRDDNLYLIPNNAKKLVVYSIKNKVFEYIQIENPVPNMYRSCYEYEGVLYCIPYRAKQILKLKINDFENVGYINVFEKKEHKDDLCINSTCRIGNNVYCVCWKKNEIMRINLEKESIVWQKVEGNYSFSHICTEGQYLFINDLISKAVVVYTSDLTTCIDSIKTDMEESLIMISNEGTLVVDSTEDNKVLFIEYKKNKGRIMNFECKEKLIDIQPWKMGAWYKDELGYIWGITNNGCLLHIVDSNKVTKIELKISKEMYRSVNKELMDQTEKMIQERKTFSLSDYLP